MAFNIISLFLGLMYILVGAYVFRFRFFIIKLDQNVAYALGTLLIAYGCFRIFRAAKRIINRRKHE